MNHWENLHLTVYWNGARTKAISVYSNGCKIEVLSGAGKCEIIEYLKSLHAQGWEKFGREQHGGDMLETFYFQRAMEQAGDLQQRRAAIPAPPFVHHQR
jgi:hypothetical protein